MASNSHIISDLQTSSGSDELEMPRATIAPLTLSLGLAMMAVGVITSPAFLIVGAAIIVAGLGLWVASLLPGRGHVHEPLAPLSRRPSAASPQPSAVEHLREGMPGYRLRLPMEVHPISAGVWGGVVGGLVMPIPALAYGLLSGHGIWYPVNLLAGMVLPGVDRMTGTELDQFHPPLLLLGTLIHVIMSVVLGLIYGVLLPTLPPISRPLAWGGLLMPLLWTGVSFVLMGSVNPVLARGVDWPWFIASQFLFGVVTAAVVIRFGRSSFNSDRARGRHRGGTTDARSGIAMEFNQRPWRLVSSKSAGRYGLARSGIATSGGAEAVSRQLAGRGKRDPRAHVGWLRHCLWTAVAPAPTDPRTSRLGRPAVASALDSHQPQSDGGRQPSAPTAGKLALVCRLAIRVRSSCRGRCTPLRKGLYHTRGTRSGKYR